MVDLNTDNTRWLCNRGSFPLLSGPCSLESPVQILAVARALAPLGVDILRAGVWKARTRPGGFEGLKGPGLKALKAAGREVQLPVACEVILPEHVEACLEEQIDVLWIGARTTVNPFAVQALADALRGVDIPVLVKNPICPELDLWLGALERLSAAGVVKLAAVHRGFSCPGGDEYRYPPMWSIPLELKGRFPDLPMLCDPSHIAGERVLVEEVARRALTLGLDGLMVESHMDPTAALSDAAQQLTPAALAALMGRLGRVARTPAPAPDGRSQRPPNP